MIPAGKAFGLVPLILWIAPIHAAKPAEVVVRKTSFGQVEVAAADVGTASEEGRAAQAAARDVLLLPDARFGITARSRGTSGWVSLASDGSPVYRWTFRSASGAGEPVPPSQALRHEIGHDLFIRHLVPSSREDQYGGDAPDWLDEMAAVAFEGREVTDVRRREAARFERGATLIPLDRFLKMTHPELATSPAPATASSGQAYRVRLSSSSDTPRFYAMARAFYDYLAERTKSPAVVAELASAFRRGESLDHWILAHTGRHDGAASLKALDADFRVWIRSDRRYGGSTPAAATNATVVAASSPAGGE